MESPDKRIGPYRLLHRIGRGGMGEVFAAANEVTGKSVALKLLLRDAAQDRQLVGRFLQEGDALARIRHPGVVSIEECAQLDDGTIFLAMELLDGLSLHDWMQRESRPAPLEASLAICTQIADAMATIHAQGIVHRDLKPGNVFLCPDATIAPGYRVKVLDFGIAKVPPAADGARFNTQVQTMESLPLGTVAYMSPEQCLDFTKAAGPADVYALGEILFELLAGRMPFLGHTAVELVSMKVKGEPPPLRELAPSVPEALCAFVAAMLAKKPEERPTMLRCRDMLGRPWKSAPDECPVPGLSPFTEAQAELFFGRGAELNELLSQLEEARTGRRRWVQLEGPSGMGKSSLVQAGLLPRLKEHLPQQAPRWRIASIRPSYDSLLGLARALRAAYAGLGSEPTLEEAVTALHAGPDGLQTLVTKYTPPGCCLLLVVEQLEELFTLGEDDRRRLDELVTTALVAPGCPLRLLTTLRSDFLHRLSQVPLLERQLNEAARYHLRTMDEEALAQVVRGLANRAGMRLAEGLAECMVRDAASEGSRLPLLGHTLQGLWALHSGETLTRQHYEQLGGVGGALAQQVEQLLKNLGPEGRTRAKWLIVDLVNVGRGVPDTRRSRSRHEVLTAAGGDALAEEVLLRLSGMRSGSLEQALRLLALSDEPDPARQRVDLVHETLLQKVPSIARWIDEVRKVLEQHGDLEDAALVWEKAGSPRKGLPQDSLLAHYRGDTADPDLRVLLTRRMSESAARYLEAAKRLERRRTWSQRALVFASGIAVAAILFSAIQAKNALRLAEANLATIVQFSVDFVSSADWKLSRLADTLDLRRELLPRHHDALASLSEAERSRPEVIEALIEARHRLGDLHFHNDPLHEAESSLEAASSELSRGMALFPEEPALKKLVAVNHSKRGKLEQARGRLGEMRDHFAKATALLEASPPQDNDDYRWTLATSYAEEAEAALALNQPAAALAFHDKAIPLFEKSAESGDAYAQSLLAEAYGMRGAAARQAGNVKAAESDLERALELAAPLIKSSPANQYFRWILARIHVERAALHEQEQRPESAAEHYRLAEGLGEEVNQGEPTNKRYALVLAQSRLGQERLAELRGDSDSLQRAQAARCALVADFVRRDPEDVRFQRLACP
jgi:serine/threonine protein kinase